MNFCPHMPTATEPSHATNETVGLAAADTMAGPGQSPGQAPPRTEEDTAREQLHLACYSWGFRNSTTHGLLLRLDHLEPRDGTATAPPITSMSEGTKEGESAERKRDTALAARRMPEMLRPMPNTSPERASVMMLAARKAGVQAIVLLLAERLGRGAEAAKEAAAAADDARQYRLSREIMSDNATWVESTPSAPLVSKRVAVAKPVAMKSPVYTMLRTEKRELPQIPWPEVHLLFMRGARTDEEAGRDDTLQGNSTARRSGGDPRRRVEEGL